MRSVQATTIDTRQALALNTIFRMPRIGKGCMANIATNTANEYGCRKHPKRAFVQRTRLRNALISRNRGVAPRSVARRERKA